QPMRHRECPVRIPRPVLPHAMKHQRVGQVGIADEAWRKLLPIQLARKWTRIVTDRQGLARTIEQLAPVAEELSAAHAPILRHLPAVECVAGSKAEELKGKLAPDTGK